MKKLEKHIAKNYPPLILYQEDMEEIVDILKSDNGSKDIEIETEDYKFSTIEDLCKKSEKKHTHRLKIYQHGDVYVSLELSGHGARLYINKDSSVGSGLFYKIDKILSAHIRTPAFIYTWGFSYLISWFWIPLQGIEYFLKHQQIEINLSSSWIFCLLGLIWLPVVWSIQTKKFSVIKLQKRSSVTSFLQKYHESIIEKLIVAAIIGISGLVLYPLVTSYKSYIDNLAYQTKAASEPSKIKTVVPAATPNKSNKKPENQ